MVAVFLVGVGSVDYLLPIHLNILTDLNTYIVMRLLRQRNSLFVCWYFLRDKHFLILGLHEANIMARYEQKKIR